MRRTKSKMFPTMVLFTVMVSLNRLQLVWSAADPSLDEQFISLFKTSVKTLYLIKYLVEFNLSSSEIDFYGREYMSIVMFLYEVYERRRGNVVADAIMTEGEVKRFSEEHHYYFESIKETCLQIQLAAEPKELEESFKKKYQKKENCVFQDFLARKYAHMENFLYQQNLFHIYFVFLMGIKEDLVIVYRRLYYQTQELGFYPLSEDLKGLRQSLLRDLKAYCKYLTSSYYEHFGTQPEIMNEKNAFDDIDVFLAWLQQLNTQINQKIAFYRKRPIRVPRVQIVKDPMELNLGHGIEFLVFSMDNQIEGLLMRFRKVSLRKAKKTPYLNFINTVMHDIRLSPLHNKGYSPRKAQRKDLTRPEEGSTHPLKINIFTLNLNPQELDMKNQEQALNRHETRPICRSLSFLSMWKESRTTTVPVTMRQGNQTKSNLYDIFLDIQLLNVIKLYLLRDYYPYLEFFIDVFVQELKELIHFPNSEDKIKFLFSSTFEAYFSTAAYPIQLVTDAIEAISKDFIMKPPKKNDTKRVMNPETIIVELCLVLKIMECGVCELNRVSLYFNFQIEKLEHIFDQESTCEGSSIGHLQRSLNDAHESEEKFLTSLVDLILSYLIEGSAKGYKVKDDTVTVLFNENILEYGLRVIAGLLFENKLASQETKYILNTITQRLDWSEHDSLQDTLRKNLEEPGIVSKPSQRNGVLLKITNSCINERDQEKNHHATTRKYISRRRPRHPNTKSLDLRRRSYKGYSSSVVRGLNFSSTMSSITFLPSSPSPLVLKGKLYGSSGGLQASPKNQNGPSSFEAIEFLILDSTDSLPKEGPGCIITSPQSMMYADLVTSGSHVKNKLCFTDDAIPLIRKTKTVVEDRDEAEEGYLESGKTILLKPVFKEDQIVKSTLILEKENKLKSTSRHKDMSLRKEMESTPFISDDSFLEASSTSDQSVVRTSSLMFTQTKNYEKKGLKSQGNFFRSVAIFIIATTPFIIFILIIYDDQNSKKDPSLGSSSS